MRNMRSRPWARDPAFYAPRSWGFQDLMRRQVRDVLFVSTSYESFIMAEDGQLGELVLSSFLDLNLIYAPNLVHAPSGTEALAMATSQSRFDLVITSTNLGDMTAAHLAHELRAGGLDVPVVLLAADHRALNDYRARGRSPDIERTFLWQGDVHILLAIVKFIEDHLNVEHDTQFGVPVFIVVEDSVRYYSSFLPVIYTELLKHSQQVISEGLNVSQKLMRMRARPKLLLASNFEEAWEYFSRYQDSVLGVISDIEFPRNGSQSSTAGIDLARMIREQRPDVALTLQSTYPENERLATSVGASFLLKGSPVMLEQLRRVMTEQFFFGDFVFRLPDGTEIDRAHDLRTLVEKLRTVPVASIAFHGGRNDFSSWLRARTEFEPAAKLRPRRLSDYASLEEMRLSLIRNIDEYRRERNRSVVADYNPASMDASEGMSRIGGGSLGGKGRGLAYASRLLDRVRPADRYQGVQITVPPAVVLATDIFEQFLERNELLGRALESEDDQELEALFLAATFPEEARDALASFLVKIRQPLAVRSSSLREDSPYQPFAGIFETWMLPNDAADLLTRLEQLISAIKRVYASTYSRHAKAFISATPYRLEEERMAVTIQKMMGARHGRLFYPDFAGVARSYNFYPSPPTTPEDGIAAVALGLGKTVVEGEPCLRFSPAYPRHIVDFSSAEDMLRSSQRGFWALQLGGTEEGAELDWADALVHCPLEVAQRDGVLGRLASTYSPENDAVYDGLARGGVPLVTFAPILKHGQFPLAEILTDVLRLSRDATSGPVEIEFAVNLSAASGTESEFGLLQLRPLGLQSEPGATDIGDVRREDLVCFSGSVLGSGRIEDIRDLVVVDKEAFQRARSRQVARAVARMNATLAGQGIPYLLIGVGRWGSTHPELGIPVSWEDIAGARVIVEAGLRDLHVTPSQGTHFFQNLVSLNLGYFTVNEDLGEGFVDWEWLLAQPAEQEEGPVRHVQLAQPVRVIMDWRTREGVIEKPDPLG